MLRLKNAGWVANSVDPDETPRSAVSHLGLYCLLRPVCPNTYGKYGMLLTPDSIEQLEIVKNGKFFIIELSFVALVRPRPIKSNIWQVIWLALVGINQYVKKYSTRFKGYGHFHIFTFFAST